MASRSYSFLPVHCFFFKLFSRRICYIYGKNNMLYIISFLQVLSLLLYNRWECHILLHIFCSAVHSKTRNPQRESPAVQSAKNSFHSDNNSIYRNFSQVHHHDVYTSLDLGPRSLRLSSFLHPTKLSRLSYYSCVSGREELFSFHIDRKSVV